VARGKQHHSNGDTRRLGSEAEGNRERAARHGAQRFVYIMHRSIYERNWGKQYDRPTFGDRTLAFIVKLLPSIGPLRALKLKIPTPAVEKLSWTASTARQSSSRRRLIRP
jgi:hypothetical protein